MSRKNFSWSPKPSDVNDLHSVTVVAQMDSSLYMVIPIGFGNWVASHNGKLLPQDGESRHAARDACRKHYERNGVKK
jgi:hypothetical protein